MLAGVQVESLADDAFRVYQIGDAAGDAVFMHGHVGGALGLIQLADRFVGVCYELVGERLCFGESFLVFYGVERCPYDDGVCVCDFLSSVTEPLTFNRSTGC